MKSDLRPFNEVLQELQSLLKLTNSEMVKRTGVSANTLAKLRSGTRKAPGRDVMHKIATGLGIKIEVLF